VVLFLLFILVLRFVRFAPEADILSTELQAHRIKALAIRLVVGTGTQSYGSSNSLANIYDSPAKVNIANKAPASKIYPTRFELSHVYSLLSLHDIGHNW